MGKLLQLDVSLIGFVFIVVFGIICVALLAAIISAPIFTVIVVRKMKLTWHCVNVPAEQPHPFWTKLRVVYSVSDDDDSFRMLTAQLAVYLFYMLATIAVAVESLLNA